MYMEPTTVVLGTSLRYQLIESSRQLVDTQDTFQYVPLLENLQAFLSNFEVLKEVGMQKVFVCKLVFIVYIYRHLNCMCRRKAF